jgi:hypothetical protein
MPNILPYLEYWLRPVPGFTAVQPALERLATRRWERTRSPPPPRSVKAELVRRFAGGPRRAFIETGTFYGDLLELLRRDFDRLESIELSPSLARRARRRFAADPRIRVHEGDSAALLEQVIRDLARPAVIWLDGHYSGPLTARGTTDTPLVQEVEAALRAGTPDDVVLVDDARLLGTNPAYPRLEELVRLFEARPGWTVAVESDIVRAGRGI